MGDWGVGELGNWGIQGSGDWKYKVDYHGVCLLCSPTFHKLNIPCAMFKRRGEAGAVLQTQLSLIELN